MTQTNQKSLELQERTGLKPTQVADLIRAAQLIFDTGGGVSGRVIIVDWQEYGIPPEVEENLKILGKKYQYESPHVPLEIVWEQLTPETRSWFIENKNWIWQVEEMLPALDED